MKNTVPTSQRLISRRIIWDACSFWDGYFTALIKISVTNIPWQVVPTAITQNIKDLLSSREVENIFENSDFVYMLNQAAGDRAILAKQLNISPHQLSYVTGSGVGEGLLFYGNVILPFVDKFPTDTELYSIMTTKLIETKQE